MTNKQAYAGLLERLQEMASEIDGDWAADNQPTSQGGPRADGDPCSPRPVNTPAEAAEAISSLLKALVDHNDALRSACQVADRDGKETNWLTLRGHLHWVLTDHHEITNDARAALNSDAPLSIGEGDRG